jgi:thiomorpholine-carboxylate dehydrogenase
MLDEGSVRRHLRMADLIPAMGRALVDLSGGRSVQPGRQMLQVPGRDGFFAVMPAFASGALGAKLVTFFPGNTGIHTHHALILLFDPGTASRLPPWTAG